MTTLAQQVQATITERFPTASVEQLNLIQSGAIAAFDTLETKGYAVASADATPVFKVAKPCSALRCLLTSTKPLLSNQ